ncbi:MAG: GNAT family N-acetyltransferase [Candidatus Hodarchaeales archaeon]|jgi:RimJ/RimL family protein N-acetyltransferase
MAELGLAITEMQLEDIAFLLDLWSRDLVMKYADEFPKLRGWSKSTSIESAWEEYQKKRAEHGHAYTQMIVRILDGTPIGESFFFPLPEGYRFGKWVKPLGISCLMADIKLLPQYWGKGVGTTAMQLVVLSVFTHTTCELFVVPPHRLNPAAIRVYEKAGFVFFPGMRSWRNHKIMELTKARFREIQ